MSPFSSKAVESNRQKQKLILDLAAAHAEIERLTLLLNLSKKTTEAVLERAVLAEAERDEALAQMAMAYEAIAKRLWVSGAGLTINGLCQMVRGHTPADAKAALEAYGREKVEQALDAANIYMIAQYDIAALGHPLDRQRILAGMEKLK